MRRFFCQSRFGGNPKGVCLFFPYPTPLVPSRTGVGWVFFQARYETGHSRKIRHCNVSGKNNMHDLIMGEYIYIYN